MIVIINGAFGVGKTTVSRLLRQRLSGSRIYDPEWAGSILIRVPSVVNLSGRGTDDFQDIALWRRSVVRGTKLVRTISQTVIVPMAFSRRDYFDEILSGLRQVDDDVRAFCLKASLDTIRGRLTMRGENFERESGAWALRKAQLCVEAHADLFFGEFIDTEILSAVEVADEVVRRLKC